MADKDLSDEQLDVIGSLAEKGLLGSTAYATKMLVREVRRHRAMVKRLERLAETCHKLNYETYSRSVADVLREYMKAGA